MTQRGRKPDVPVDSENENVQVEPKVEQVKQPQAKPLPNGFKIFQKWRMKIESYSKDKSGDLSVPHRRDEYGNPAGWINMKKVELLRERITMDQGSADLLNSHVHTTLEYFELKK